MHGNPTRKVFSAPTRIGRQSALHCLRAVAVAGLCVAIAYHCPAQSVADDPPPVPPQMELRSGGVLEESYVYHHQPQMQVVAPATTVEQVGGWYGYGFPVSTFRWGWFGAAHYYPTVWWHDGYYGDCCRYAYRRGY